MNLKHFLLPGEEVNVFRAAMLISMTDTIEEEKELMDFFSKRDCRCAAVMISGSDAEALKKNQSYCCWCLSECGCYTKNTQPYPSAGAWRT